MCRLIRLVQSERIAFLRGPSSDLEKTHGPTVENASPRYEDVVPVVIPGDCDHDGDVDADDLDLFVA